MIGNISKSKGFKGDTGPIGPQGPQGEQGIQGEKGDSPAIVLRLDDTGNLYYNSDGILIDKEYVESQNLVTKDEMQVYIDEEVKIIKSDIEGVQQQLNEEAHFRGYLSTNAKIQALEAPPNDFAYSAESGTKWVYDVENGWQDTGTPVPDQLTPASDATPLINGTASAGKANEYARGDHRHPTDTTRVSVEEFNKFKIENAAARKLKLLKTITLEEDVASLNVEFDKPVDEIAMLFNVAFLVAETKVMAAYTDGGGWYMFWAGGAMKTTKQFFFVHTKEYAERHWETFASGAFFDGLQGISNSTTTPKIVLSHRHNSMTRFVKDLTISIPINANENAFVAGSTIQIWGHEADENL